MSCTITICMPTLKTFQSSDFENPTKFKEHVLNSLQNLHAPKDVEVIRTFLQGAQTENQLAYELHSQPFVLHTITILGSSTLLQSSENSLTQVEATAKKVSKAVFSMDPRKVEDSDEDDNYDTEHANHRLKEIYIFSSEEANESEDPILKAFFNSEQLTKVILSHSEYVGSDTIEYVMNPINRTVSEDTNESEYVNVEPCSHDENDGVLI